MLTCELRVRTLDPTTDDLPHQLLDQFACVGNHLDPDWVWVLESDYGICAACVGAPMHGVLFLARIASTPDAPPMWPRLLLEAVFEDAKERGLEGMWTILDASRKEERRLGTILTRAGGNVIPGLHYLGFGNFDRMRTR